MRIPFLPFKMGVSIPDNVCKTLGIMLCLEFSTRPLGDAADDNGDETISPISYKLKTQ